MCLYLLESSPRTWTSLCRNGNGCTALASAAHNPRKLSWCISELASAGQWCRAPAISSLNQLQKLSVAVMAAATARAVSAAATAVSAACAHESSSSGAGHCNCACPLTAAAKKRVGRRHRSGAASQRGREAAAGRAAAAAPVINNALPLSPRLRRRHRRGPYSGHHDGLREPAPTNLRARRFRARTSGQPGRTSTDTGRRASAPVARAPGSRKVRLRGGGELVADDPPKAALRLRLRRLCRLRPPDELWKPAPTLTRCSSGELCQRPVHWAPGRCSQCCTLICCTLLQCVLSLNLPTSSLPHIIRSEN